MKILISFVLAALTTASAHSQTQGEIFHRCGRATEVYTESVVYTRANMDRTYIQLQMHDEPSIKAPISAVVSAAIHDHILQLALASLANSALTLCLRYERYMAVGEGIIDASLKNY